MAANGSIVPDFMRRGKQRPIVVVERPKYRMLQSPAVVENVLEELKTRDADLSAKDLFEGHIQVYSTADARVQQIVTLSLEHGLLLYEKRHPSAKGLIQGSVVALKNSDASILAEAGGRQLYKDRSASYTRHECCAKETPSGWLSPAQLGVAAAAHSASRHRLSNSQRAHEPGENNTDPIPSRR
jgi:hypothetical protein